MFFADDIRKWYKNGGGSLTMFNSANVIEVLRNSGEMIAAYKQYEEATSSAAGSHDPAMVHRRPTLPERLLKAVELSQTHLARPPL